MNGPFNSSNDTELGEVRPQPIKTCSFITKARARADGRKKTALTTKSASNRKDAECFKGRVKTRPYEIPLRALSASAVRSESFFTTETQSMQRVY
jgi:hypothetical protein